MLLPGERLTLPLWPALSLSLVVKEGDGLLVLQGAVSKTLDPFLHALLALFPLLEASVLTGLSGDSDASLEGESPVHGL